MEFLETRTDIGLIRDNNEDASIAIYHPKSKNLKLLMKYLKLFDLDVDYQAFIGGGITSNLM